MSLPPDFSRVSIREHAENRNTDQLYEPLRETFVNPMSVQRHAALTPIAARSSFVSKQYKIFSPEELHRLGQNVYIPNAPLNPTNNLAPIRSQKFMAVDASQRITGTPITPEELQRIRSQGFKKQEVLYEVAREQSTRPIKLNSPPVPLQPVPQQVVYEYQPVAERYTVQNYDNYGKNENEYKYNLFSIVDQPFNKCRELGLQGCASCPGNEIIASRNRPLSLTWN